MTGAQNGVDQESRPPPLRAALYGRVSTERQDVDLQRSRLRAVAKERNYTVVKEYYEVWTGATRERPKLRAMLEDASKGLFDAVLVTRLDRLGRSLGDLIVILEDLKAKKVDFVCVEQMIDTTTPHGKFIFQMFGAVSEFERGIISERTRAGRARAEAAGKMCHRPRKPINEALLRDFVQKGYGYAVIGKALGVGTSTARMRVKELGLR